MLNSVWSCINNLFFKFFLSLNSLVSYYKRGATVSKKTLLKAAGLTWLAKVHKSMRFT